MQPIAAVAVLVLPSALTRSPADLLTGVGGGAHGERLWLSDDDIYIKFYLITMTARLFAD